ncbi:uncharacterized protein LOC108864072 [Galendromus occidentalis]|uniref:RNA-directed DNA polymerase n=1 Tax=Galendromus occidentalis TaxID=34638 RepID=A0AAJ7L3B9_9ACAR|nr:uncharacterized protein LOC108864072 [Galendromus occidentalis]
MSDKALKKELESGNEYRMLQSSDESIRERIGILEKARVERSRGELNLVQDFMMLKGVLFKVIDGRRLFVVSNAMRKYILVMAHDKAGHFGMDETMELIRRVYWFPRMREYVAHHLKMCIECIFNKEQSSRREGMCNVIRPERRPFEKVFVDHAVPATTAAGLIKFLERVFMTYGRPTRLVSDRGTAHTAKSFEEFLIANGVKHVLVSTQHPQSQGQAVEEVQEKVWTPAREVQEAVIEQIEKAQDRYAYYYDRKRRPH